MSGMRYLSRLDQVKTELIENAVALARPAEGTGGPPHDQVADLLRAYYRQVAPEDIVNRSEMDVYGAFAAHCKLAANRPEGTANVKVTAPALADHRWSVEGHSVVEVVVDDMPFLVDSLTMELSRQLRGVHVVVHPTFDVVRDIAGVLQSMQPVADGALEPEAEAVRESWMHVEIDRLPEDDDSEEIVGNIQRVLRDVREAVEDWRKLAALVEEMVAGLGDDPPPLEAEEVRQVGEFLQWLADAHFTFLGYKEYKLESRGLDEYLRAVPGTGLGILRADPAAPAALPAGVAAHARDKQLLVLTKANSKATVHRPVHLDYVGVKTFDEVGEVVGERRFLGLFSSAAYTESLTRIPVIREKAKQVIDNAGFGPLSHTGKALMDVLETYPRDELFQTPVDELVPIAEAVLHTRERRQLRLFARRDTYGRYLSCLIYLPRDRYTTPVRERISAILNAQFGGESVEHTARVNESPLALLHFVVRPMKGEQIGDFDHVDLERRLTDAARSWRDDFVSSVHEEYGEENGARLARTYADSFPEAYKEDFPPRTAAVDLGRIEAIEGDEGMALSLYERVDAALGEARLKVVRIGPSLSLSEMLPILSTTGVEVVDERPYELEGLARESYIYDFGLRYSRPLPASARELFQDTVAAVWDGLNESDGFNALVLAAGLTWRQASVLRAYAKYMRQGGTPFAQDYLEDALRQNVDITRHLVALFEARFDPGREGNLAADSEARQTTCGELEERITRALDEVTSLDHDRILRSYLTHIKATLRTNYFQEDKAGGPHAYISLKLESSAIPELPQPRPKFEIFVYSPRVEGVHLRFGAVARGGLRWSDRRDDFRTEVLGLVKAQMVKNTVIVPVGAKGGFICKLLPDPGDRDACMAEGVACYITFISGLLDITDNLVDGETVPPEGVLRLDGDDSYLVVGADKGTATFSDIANGVAKDYGFWLGDAFASGGSAGYDHKAVGVTARGAWVSVLRHFREMGIDCQDEDFTCIGIGDMSGDVFGNGMLCSEHTRLVAAFDHRDIFVDPDPDPKTSYAERRRLFELPGSSWQDYGKALISEGGGVYPRSLKSVPLNDAVRELLGIDESVQAMAPAELMKAILLAPVDLLWNGGIGTYVKGRSETHAEVSDKANDAIRINGSELRARCVGEGVDQGLTQAARVEFSEAGGRINTDSTDSCAGEDFSDREVNGRILLDRMVAESLLTPSAREALWSSLGAEIEQQVLGAAARRVIALGHEREGAEPRYAGQLRLTDWLASIHGPAGASEATSLVNRTAGHHLKLTSPELSALTHELARVIKQEFVQADERGAGVLPADIYERLLRSYFPASVSSGATVVQHPLGREIVAAQAAGTGVGVIGLDGVRLASGEDSVGRRRTMTPTTYVDSINTAGPVR